MAPWHCKALGSKHSLTVTMTLYPGRRHFLSTCVSESGTYRELYVTGGGYAGRDGCGECGSGGFHRGAWTCVLQPTARISPGGSGGFWISPRAVVVHPLLSRSEPPPQELVRLRSLWHPRPWRPRLRPPFPYLCSSPPPEGCPKGGVGWVCIRGSSSPPPLRSSVPSATSVVRSVPGDGHAEFVRGSRLAGAGWLRPARIQTRRPGGRRAQCRP